MFLGKEIFRVRMVRNVHYSPFVFRISIQLSLKMVVTRDLYYGLRILQEVCCSTLTNAARACEKGSGDSATIPAAALPIQATEVEIHG
jgi:hypothetical protein